ncbi:MAG: hypothetical protein DMG91_13475 [Acidobacteria bacterium]|nr:MAG: hypothetical protein DMG91_13475 [Acidobacteriota bacterium]
MDCTGASLESRVIWRRANSAVRLLSSSRKVLMSSSCVGRFTCSQSLTLLPVFSSSTGKPWRMT